MTGGRTFKIGVTFSKRTIYNGFSLLGGGFFALNSIALQSQKN